jgi:hypothetical protein
MKNDNSLLDIHIYSKEALRHMLNRFRSKSFQRDYIYDKKAVNAVSGILWDIMQEDKEVVEIVKEMDEIDGIKAQKGKCYVEKTTITWLQKAYFVHIMQGYYVSFRMLVNFFMGILHPSSEKERQLKSIVKYYFNKYNDKYKKRLSRSRRNERLAELQKKYPKLNITDAFAYGLILEKFSTTNNDLELFEKIVKIMLHKKVN